MELCKIDPYVRYIHPFVPAKGVRTVMAPDHRIFYVTAGRLGVELDGRTVSLSATDLIYLPSGSPYRLFAEGEAQTRAIGVNFDFFQPPPHREGILLPLKESEFDPEMKWETPAFSDAPAFGQVFLLKKQMQAGEALERMLDEAREGGRWQRALLDSRMKLFLLELARKETDSDPKSSRLLESLTEYIRQNYQRPLSNEEIGRALNFHPNYLNRLMVKSKGKTIHRFLTDYRIQRGAILLQTTDLGVSEIATRVGFGDVQQFSKSFRARMGTGPVAFRRNI